MHFYQVSGFLSLGLLLDLSGCQHGLWRRALTERQREGSNEALELCQWSHILAMSSGELQETEKFVFLGRQDQAPSS